MNKPTLKDLLAFTNNIVLPFYVVKRHNTVPIKSGQNETDAEHSWSVALLACALAAQIDPDLDTGKISEFAVIHDLVEVYSGDTSNFASRSKLLSKDRREKAALEKLKSELSALSWITQTIEDYESQKTGEARFVKAVDKLLPLLFDYLENGRFYHENKITKQHWVEQMQNHRQKAKSHSGVYEYYEELRTLLLNSPDIFYKD